MLFDKIRLEENEKVLKVVRRHWFIITIELLAVAILAILPTLIVLAFHLMSNNSSPEEGSRFVDISSHMPLIWFGLVTWWLLCAMIAGAAWTHYYLDIWAVTDRRIVSIDQVHFFNRKVNSFRLERLQDIKVQINGIIPTLLNFGTIRAQTAGAIENNFKARGLPDPRNLQAIIQQATDNRLKYIYQGEQSQQANPPQQFSPRIFPENT